jgi:glycosyltransferase involved in cell wall biosynthesis
VQYRILILENELGLGGTEKKLFEFLNRIDRSRFHVAVCCLKQAGYFKSKLQSIDVPVYEGLLGHRFDALAYRKLESILRAEQTQLIYTFSHPNTVIFAFLARMRGLVESWIVSYHATGHAEGGRLIPHYLLPFLRRADALVAVAEMQKDYLAGSEGLPRDRLRVIRNGVDAGVYRPGDREERASARAELGLGSDDLVVMAVASLKPLKRLDLLLRAAAPMLRARADARLVIVGDGPERGALDLLSRDLGIEERVTLVGMREDVERVMRAADLLVLSSRTEAFPNVILEGMATGLPVVTTDVGSVREMVEEGRNALIVERDNEAALRGAIERMAEDAEMRRAFGRRGRDIVDARFRIEDMCAARERLFEELLRKDRAA